MIKYYKKHMDNIIKGDAYELFERNYMTNLIMFNQLDVYLQIYQLLLMLSFSHIY